MARTFEFPKGKFGASMGEIDKAEYSPWGRIFLRMEMLCDIISELSIEMRSKRTGVIELFFNSLIELNDQLSPLLIQQVEDKFQLKFKDLKMRMELWRRNVSVTGKNLYPETLVVDMEQLKNDLFEMKQIIGLGVPVEKAVSIKTKLNRTLGLDTEK